MNKETYKLKSTGQQVYPMPWTANCPAPWPDTHLRVILPYTDIELRGSRKGLKNHIRVVRKDSVRVA